MIMIVREKWRPRELWLGSMVDKQRGIQKLGGLALGSELVSIAMDSLPPQTLGADDNPILLGTGQATAGANGYEQLSVDTRHSIEQRIYGCKLSFCICIWGHLKL